MELATASPETEATLIDTAELALAGLRSHFEDQTGGDQLPFTD